MGKPASPPEQPCSSSVLTGVRELFEECKGGLIGRKEFGSVTKALDLPLYWKCPLFEACSSEETCSYEQLLQVRNRVVNMQLNDPPVYLFVCSLCI